MRYVELHYQNVPMYPTTGLTLRNIVDCFGGVLLMVLMIAGMCTSVSFFPKDKIGVFPIPNLLLAVPLHQ